MKMEQKDYSMIKKDFSENINLINDHYDFLQELERSGLQELERSGKIQNIENRLSWDAYYGIVSQENRKVITWERDYNDSHILTGIKKALKELGVI